MCPKKYICHKGFGGVRKFVARLNFRISGQETTLQSFMAYTLERFVHARQKNELAK